MLLSSSTLWHDIAFFNLNWTCQKQFFIIIVSFFMDMVIIWQVPLLRIARRCVRSHCIVILMPSSIPRHDHCLFKFEYNLSKSLLSLLLVLQGCSHHMMTSNQGGCSTEIRRRLAMAKTSIVMFTWWPISEFSYLWPCNIDPLIPKS